RDVLADIAREHGQRIGAGLRLAHGASSPVFESLVELLARNGYEPRVSGNLISLVNCPFHVLTEEHRDIVCHLNYQLICGLAEAAGLSPGAAKLDPGAGRCCVTLTGKYADVRAG
ncbi:MAG: transcriptional regulator, partial [Candidatus Dormibacteria bacterium]